MLNHEILHEHAGPRDWHSSPLTLLTERRHRSDEIWRKIIEEASLEHRLHRRGNKVHAGTGEVVGFVKGGVDEDRADVVQGD